jgi:hypothetical protein
LMRSSKGLRKMGGKHHFSPFSFIRLINFISCSFL